ncbi:hypothetical protein ACEQ8H_002286 [Pleosporales sp. CAS-2024a]
MFLTLFLLERVRVVRAPFIERRRDAIWIGGCILTVGGYLGVMGFMSVAPESILSRVDGNCRIGIQANASKGVIVLDCTYNVILTLIFVQQLKPVVRPSCTRRSFSYTGGQQQPRKTGSLSRLMSLKEYRTGTITRTSFEGNLRAMLIRNLVGSVLLIANTIVSNVIFLKWGNASLRSPNSHGDRVSYPSTMLCPDPSIYSKPGMHSPSSTLDTSISDTDLLAENHQRPQVMSKAVCRSDYPRMGPVPMG